MNHQKLLQKIAGIVIIILSTVGCSATASATSNATSIPPTLSATITPVPPTPTVTPMPEPDSLLSIAGPLCQSSFAAQMTGGSPQSSLLTLIRDANQQEWIYDETVISADLEAKSASEVHTLVCIKEEISESGEYYGGAKAYSRTWEIRLVGYPEGTVFSSVQITNPPPFTKNNANKGIGSRPVEELSLWLQGLGHNTIIPYGVNLQVAAFASDGTIMASAAERGQGLKLWNVSDIQVIDSFSNYDVFLRQLSFSPDGELLALVGDTLVLVDVSTGEKVRTLSSDVWRAAFSPNGKLLAICTHQSGNVELWDIQSGGQKVIFRNHGIWVKLVTFSPDGKLIASGDVTGKVFVWDAATGEVVHTFQVLYDLSLDALAFSPDGTMLAAPTDLGTIIVWDVTSGEQIKTFTTEETQGIHSLAFSQDSKILAAGLEYASVQLWPVDGGEPTILGGFLKGVEILTFLADGQTLAAADNYGTAILWDVEAWSAK